MTIEKLEAALRALGWMPVSSDRSTTSRAWKRVNDARPDAIIIRVPRADWVQPSLARRILRQAIRAELR